MNNISLHSILNEMVSNLTEAEVVTVPGLGSPVYREPLNKEPKEDLVVAKHNSEVSGKDMVVDPQSGTPVVREEIPSDQTNQSLVDRGSELLGQGVEWVKDNPYLAGGALAAALASGAGALALRRKLAAQKRG